MIKLRQTVVLLLCCQLLEASTHHRHHQIDIIDPSIFPITEILVEEDSDFPMTQEDRQLLHKQLIKSKSEIKNVGTFIHIAGVLTSNKALETTGIAIEIASEILTPQNMRPKAPCNTPVITPFVSPDRTPSVSPIIKKVKNAKNIKEIDYWTDISE